MRLIDADKLREYYESRGYDLVVLRNIDDMPTVDAEPVRHGHWVSRFTGNQCIVFCSNCRTEACEIVDCEIEYNYCPNCGAKMDEEVTK